MTSADAPAARIRAAGRIERTPEHGEPVTVQTCERTTCRAETVGTARYCSDRCFELDYDLRAPATVRRKGGTPGLYTQHHRAPVVVHRPAAHAACVTDERDPVLAELARTRPSPAHETLTPEGTP